MPLRAAFAPRRRALLLSAAAAVACPLRSDARAPCTPAAPSDVGGFRVAFDSRRRSSAFVTQSMLTPDGRVVG